jgi:hypothetical protein
MAAGGFTAQAQTGTTNTSKLEQENQDLRKRVDKLEQILEKEGLKPSSSAANADPPVSALSEITLSGFVSTSYFYDAASTHDATPMGYLWNRSLNSFDLNKIKLTLASPAVDKDKWDAAFRVSFIWGQDAPFVDTGSTKDPGFSWIREAYAELNIPIGTGLDIKAGELISLLNYESGDGGAVNGNFSQGYQWFYTGNPPSESVQLAYDFNDMFGLKLRLQDGLYAGPISSGEKTFVGGFYVKPDTNTSLAFLGFVSRQYSPSYTLAGGSFIGSRRLMESHNLTLATEADYFRFSGFNPATTVAMPASLNSDGSTTPATYLGSGATSGDWWSVGLWLSADIVPKLGVTLRGDYISDPTGFGTGVNSPLFTPLLYTSGTGQELNSVTLTLNWMPTATLKIQPEIRWNHTDNTVAFGYKKDQVIVGAGASYIF